MGGTGLFDNSLFSTDSENPDIPILPIRIKTMARPKKNAPVEEAKQPLEASVADENIKVDEVVNEDIEEAKTEDFEVEESTEESPEKQAFRAKVEAYKISNPVKYERKKEHFEATLRGMK